jgi:hypothetical protein
MDNDVVDTKQVSAALSAEDQEFFHREGYLMLPGFIEDDYRERIKADVDQLMLDRQNKDERFLVAYKEMGLLTSHPALIEKLQALMGPRFAMHHIHAVRQDAGNRGVNWHQDYEQYPQTNRSHIMVHVFYYLDGLNGEIGDLLVLPRSQNMVIANGGLGLFGTEDLPGSICVDNVSPGTAIIVHSGVWHARRAKPGGENFSALLYRRLLLPARRAVAGLQRGNAAGNQLHGIRDGLWSRWGLRFPLRHDPVL